MLRNMKNQYFGDINDYRKYGLLRAISRVSDFHILVAWMLTPDDGSTDGKFTKYLSEPGKWSKYDPDLFSHLSKILNAHSDRKVEHIEKTGLLKSTEYYLNLVPDNAEDRNIWFSELLLKTKNTDLVFLDPDNGLEIKSKPYGRKYSSKFLFWREVTSLWESGNSLLIYQHFIRENRVNFIQRMLETLSENTVNSFIEAFSTPHVAFLLALQPKHQHFHGAIIESVQKNWSGQIKHWDLIRAQPGARAGSYASQRAPQL